MDHWQVTGNLGYPNRSNRGYPTLTGGEQRLTAVTGLRICSGADGTLNVHCKFETARAAASGERHLKLYSVQFSVLHALTS